MKRKQLRDSQLLKSSVSVKKRTGIPMQNLNHNHLIINKINSQNACVIEKWFSYLQRQKQEIDIMKFTIHHISDLAICLRSPKRWEQFLQELLGDSLYIHKRENYKDMLC